MGQVPPGVFPISWGLHTGQIQEGDPLQRRNLLFASFYTKVLAAVPDLAWCLLPSKPHSEKAHSNSPPNKLILPAKPNIYKTKIHGTTQPEGNSPQLSQRCKCNAENCKFTCGQFFRRKLLVRELAVRKNQTSQIYIHAVLYATLNTANSDTCTFSRKLHVSEFAIFPGGV